MIDCRIRPFRIHREKGGFEPPDDLIPFRGLRLRLLGRRHFAIGADVEDAFPALAVGQDGGGVGEGVEGHVALVRPVRVAIRAIPVEHRQHVAVESGLGPRGIHLGQAIRDPGIRASMIRQNAGGDGSCHQHADHEELMSRS